MSQINKIGVIGAGNMGSGIAQKIAQEGLNVVVVDIKDEYVERGLGIIKQLLSEGVERKIFTAGQVEEIFTRITGTTDFNAVADADLVIEAVFEDRQVKSELFKKLDQLALRKPFWPPTHPVFLCVSSLSRHPVLTVSLVSIISTTLRKTGF